MRKSVKRKIPKIKVPYFAGDQNRRITIFFGMEERVRLYPSGKICVKIEPCDKCGRCCMEVSANWQFGRTDDGWCTFLELRRNKYICSLGTGMPWGCSVRDHSLMDYCSVEWKEL